MQNQKLKKRLKKRLKNEPATVDQINKIAERAKLSAVIESVETLVVISLLVLRNMGWGAKRLARFKAEFQKQLTMLEDGWFTIQDVAEMLEEEANFDVFNKEAGN